MKNKPCTEAVLRETKRLRKVVDDANRRLDSGKRYLPKNAESSKKGGV